MRLAFSRDYFRRKNEAGRTRQFRAHPRISDRKLIKLPRDQLEIGPEHGLVQPQEQFARLDLLPFLDRDFLDHAARRVLDLLDVAVDDDES
jgi:hypothetical protein